LEGGPSDGVKKGWVTCDALLLSNETDPAYVLEVEGANHAKALDRVLRFFDAKDREDPRRSSIVVPARGAIVCAYSYVPVGRKSSREFPNVKVDETLIPKARAILEKHRDKVIIIVAVNKKIDREAGGLRRRNDYYPGTVKEIKAFELRHAVDATVPKVYYTHP
jgi:hypothetical protein